MHHKVFDGQALPRSTGGAHSDLPTPLAGFQGYWGEEWEKEKEVEGTKEQRDGKRALEKGESGRWERVLADLMNTPPFLHHSYASDYCLASGNICTFSFCLAGLVLYSLSTLACVPVPYPVEQDYYWPGVRLSANQQHHSTDGKMWRVMYRKQHNNLNWILSIARR